MPRTLSRTSVFSTRLPPELSRRDQRMWRKRRARGRAHRAALRRPRPRERPTSRAVPEPANLVFLGSREPPGQAAPGRGRRVDRAADAARRRRSPPSSPARSSARLVDATQPVDAAVTFLGGTKPQVDIAVAAGAPLAGRRQGQARPEAQARPQGQRRLLHQAARQQRATSRPPPVTTTATTTGSPARSRRRSDRPRPASSAPTRIRRSTSSCRSSRAPRRAPRTAPTCTWRRVPRRSRRRSKRSSS